MLVRNEENMEWDNQEGLQKMTAFQERLRDQYKWFGNMVVVIKASEPCKPGVCQHHHSEFPMCKSVYGQVTGICNYLLIVGTCIRRKIKQYPCKIMYSFLF